MQDADSFPSDSDKHDESVLVCQFKEVIKKKLGDIDLPCPNVQTVEEHF